MAKNNRQGKKKRENILPRILTPPATE